MRGNGLSVGEQRFIDALGSYFERQGAPRIGGRILGLLMLAREPLSLGHVAKLLRVSPASVSTNIRQLIASGSAELAHVPGDRRHYYVFSLSGWEAYLRHVVEQLRAFTLLCEQGAAAPDVRNKPRLLEAGEFFQFFSQELVGITERWRTHTARRQAPASASSRSPRTRRGARR